MLSENPNKMHSFLEKNEKGHEKLIIQIDLKGKKHRIVVREGDGPSVLAKSFCETHNLPENIFESLRDLIDKSIEDLIYEEEYLGQPQHRNNPGAHMYYRGKIMRERHSLANESKKKVLEMSELQGATFKPVLAPKSKKLTRSGSELKFSQRLYDHAFEAIEKKATSKNDRFNFLSFNPSIKKFNTTPIVYPKYSALFQLLNPTMGRVSAETIDKDALPRKIKKVLTPFIDALGAETTASFREFSRYIDSVFARLSPNSRNALHCLASDKNIDAYERLTSYNIFKTQKVKTLKRNQSKKEGFECSFRPKLVAKLFN